MKHQYIAIAGLLASPFAHAIGTINYTDPAIGGIGYEWTVTLGSNDTVNTGTNANSHVGAWSWEDQSLDATPALGETTVGWTHTSQWAAVTLGTASYFTVRLDASSLIPFTGSGNVGGFRPSNHFYPSFTLYSGWDNDDMPDAVATILGGEPSDGEWHTYNNRGNNAWAEDTTFIGLVDNSTLSSAEATYLLPAGNYTIALGSNAPSTSNPPRQGFLASFTTTPVPEPSSALLGTLALGGFAIRRRR